MFLDHFPEQYKLSPELCEEFTSRARQPFFRSLQRLHLILAHVLGIKEESRLGVIQTLWNYIKLQGLQDKTDRRMIHSDEKLRSVSVSYSFPTSGLLMLCVGF